MSNVGRNMKLSPKETIRAYCINCLGLKQWNRNEIEDCQGDQALNGACPFYPYRLGRRPSVKVFRQYCLYCNGGSRELVSTCPIESCPVYLYRFGRNPALIGKRKAPKAGIEALRKYQKKAVDDVKKEPESIFSQAVDTYYDQDHSFNTFKNKTRAQIGHTPPAS